MFWWLLRVLAFLYRQDSGGYLLIMREGENGGSPFLCGLAFDDRNKTHFKLLAGSQSATNLLILTVFRCFD